MSTYRMSDGFTLVELMVVVLIIGILVAIAIPVFNTAAESARVRTCESNQRLIEGAAEMYRAAHDHLWTQGHRLNGNGSANSADLLVPTYLKTAPTCPKSGLYYYVEANGTVTGDRSDHSWIAGHGHY